MPAAGRAPAPRNTMGRWFVVGVALKGVDGVLEVLGGLFLLVAGPRTLGALVYFLTAHELSEDPHDLVATFLRRSLQRVSSDTALFASAYLLLHGLLKVLLAAGLLRGKRWAFPAALWFLATFDLYQSYRALQTHSLGLMSLTIVDIVVMVLIWNEYRARKRARRPRAPGTTPSL